MIQTYGAQDEAPRFPKPLNSAVSLFKELKLDALIHGVNAAGLSAFNPVERRMAPLSHDLIGIILPHDTFGTHLDDNGKTLDLELEEQNLFAAAEALSEVWSKTVIDNHKINCKAVKKGSEFVAEQPSANWLSKHVIQSRYCLQIVKCLQVNCCETFQTNWKDIFPKQFIPPPAIYKFGSKCLEIIEPSVYFENHTQTQFKFASLQVRLVTNLVSEESLRSKKGVPRPTPFNTYCPSMLSKIDDCVCEKCSLSWPCCAAKKRHLKIHSKNSEEKEVYSEPFDIVDEIDSDDHEEPLEVQEESESIMPIIGNIRDHLVSPFLQLFDEISQ